jgi:prolyl-tRNA synthetase
MVMRMSCAFGRTERHAPAEAGSACHRLFLRAGLGAFHASGIPSFLPIGWRVVRRLEAMLR